MLIGIKTICNYIVINKKNFYWDLYRYYLLFKFVADLVGNFLVHSVKTCICIRFRVLEIINNF